MSDIKLKQLEKRITELEARIEALENMEEILVFQPPGEDYTVEFTPDPEFFKGLEMFRNNMDASFGPYELSGGGPLTTAEIHHFPGLSDEDANLPEDED